MVLLDEGESETDIQVKIDMAPNKYPMSITGWFLAMLGALRMQSSSKK